MLDEQQILKLLKTQGIVRGEEVYLSPSSTLQLLALCDQNDFAILGLEGFRVSGDQLTPDLDLILDCSAFVGSSWEEFRDTCNSRCGGFVEQLRDAHDLVLCPVLISKNEWMSGKGFAGN